MNHAVFLELRHEFISSNCVKPDRILNATIIRHMMHTGEFCTNQYDNIQRVETEIQVSKPLEVLEQYKNLTAVSLQSCHLQSIQYTCANKEMKTTKHYGLQRRAIYAHTQH